MYLNVGHVIMLASSILLILGTHATLFSVFYPETGIWVGQHAKALPSLRDTEPALSKHRY